MKRVLAAAAGAAILTASTAALACSPPVHEPVSAQANGKAASQPTFANAIRSAHDISVVRVDELGSVPDTAVPERYRAGLRHLPLEAMPVRYRFTVLDRLKGAPPATFEFATPRADLWPASPDDLDSIKAMLNEENDPDWWRRAALWLGPLTVRSDCSMQIGFLSGDAYLVFRNSAGEVTAARPVRRDGPLVRAIEVILRRPDIDYPHRLSVRDYLRAARTRALVEVVDCTAGRLRVVERLGRHGGPGAASGDVYEARELLPPLGTPGCKRGRRFVEVAGSLVTFEDRYMQMRLDGPKAVPLRDVRALAAAP